MKTTLILPDPLLQKAKLVAQKRGTSVTRIMQDALREYLASESKPIPKKQWRIRPSGKGGYVSAEYDGNWQKIRDELYSPE